MFAEYIQAALERAQYKIIDDEEPYFATVPELPGVWASGKTIEECRKELMSVIEGWVLLRLRMGRSIPYVAGKKHNCLCRAGERCRISSLQSLAES